VEAQREDPGSMLQLYRRLLALRRASPALALGEQRWLDAPAGVLAWERRRGDDRAIVAMNFRSEPERVALPGALRLLVASDGCGEGAPFGGTLGADQACVMAPH